MATSNGLPKWARSGARDPRIERLIAVGRVVLVALTLLALSIDPLDPPANNDRVNLILLLYLAVAALLAVVCFLDRRLGTWQLVVHVADIGVASLLLHLSSLSVSPFFSYFVFVLLSGTLRWHAAGAFWTSVGAFALYVAIVWNDLLGIGGLSHKTDTPLNRAVVQATFLLVAGTLLASFGRLYERNQSRLGQLAQWPSSVGGAARSDDRALEPVFRHAAAVMKSPRIVVLWREADEPFVGVASLVPAGFSVQSKRDAELDEALESMERPEGAGSFALNASRPSSIVTADGRRLAARAPLPAVLASRFAIHGACTAAFREAICRGRVFLLDREGWGMDDIVLAEIVAARIGAELEQRALRRQVEELGAARARAQLARDMHDGALQNLTAVRLRLAAIEPRLAGEEREQLQGVAELLREEQRRIREFVETTRAPVSVRPSRPFEIAAEIGRVIDNARETWGCTVDFKVEPHDAAIAPEAGRELVYLLTEALANAIRHGHASRIDIAIWRRADRLAIRIRNDGAPIVGELGAFDLPRVNALNLGPRSVRERIAALGGSLVLTNRAQGVDLEVTIPLA